VKYLLLFPLLLVGVPLAPIDPPRVYTRQEAEAIADTARALMEAISAGFARGAIDSVLPDRPKVGGKK
jgi:hypothetical protein